MIEKLESLPFIAQIVLIIFYDLYGNILRLLRSVEKKNTLGIVLAILILIFGGIVTLIFDLVTFIVYKKIFWID